MATVWWWLYDNYSDSGDIYS